MQAKSQDLDQVLRALRSTGESFNIIAARLNRLGIKRPLGGRWYGATVQAAIEGPCSGGVHRCTAACREQRRPCTQQAAPATDQGGRD
jgi:hypothetical protein